MKKFEKIKQKYVRRRQTKNKKKYMKEYMNKYKKSQ